MKPLIRDFLIIASVVIIAGLIDLRAGIVAYVIAIFYDDLMRWVQAGGADKSSTRIL